MGEVEPVFIDCPAHMLDYCVNCEDRGTVISYEIEEEPEPDYEEMWLSKMEARAERELLRLDRLL